MNELETPKYTEIEYKNRASGEWDRQKISAVFKLGIIATPMGEGEYCGINIGIVIPHDSQESASKFKDKFYCDYFMKKEYETERIYLFLIGTFLGKECRVPLLYCNGNEYDSKMGSSCLFVYADPHIMGPDPRP